MNWVKLLDEGLKRQKKVGIQAMKSKRTFALLEVYEKDNYSIVEAITRGQAEGSTEKVYK